MKKCAIFFSNISLQRKALEIWGCRSMHGLPFLAAFFSFNISTNIITLQIKCMFWSQIIKIKTYFPILSAPTLTNMFVRRKHFVFSTMWQWTWRNFPLSFWNGAFSTSADQRKNVHIWLWLLMWYNFSLYEMILTSEHISKLPIVFRHTVHL